MRIFSFSLLFILLSGFETFSSQSSTVLDDPLVLSLKDTPLQSVLGTITKETGMSILIDKDLDNKKITGEFIVKDVEKFIRRCLLGYNLAIGYTPSNRVLDIHIFGISTSEPSQQSSLVEKDVSLISAVTNQRFEENNPLTSVEPITGTPYSEIKLIKENGDAAIKAYYSNPNSIEPITGMSLAEIKLIQDKANAHHTDEINNSLN